MLVHFLHLLGRALATMPTLVSSNWAAVLMAVGIFLLSQFLNLIFRGKSYMKRQWQQSIAIGVFSVLAGWFVLYQWSLIVTVYSDHQSLVVHNQELTQKNGELINKSSQLVDPKSRDDQIAELKKTLKAYESPGIRIYPVSHDQRPGTPKMEYVLSTGKIRTPVDLTAKCDFPIADMGVVFMTTTGGSAQYVSKQRVFPMQYKLSITSPAWSPSSPLWLTVFFEGTVDRMPSCTFLVD
ncbi:MAG TPA: hypothetical protein VGH37_12195 [Candidatus Acidoferrum sp.]|jgi:NADH:ubiquinone oxidoreductase subunit K